ncbi:3700_t:CDS:1, partial [Gigaspora margarita]
EVNDKIDTPLITSNRNDSLQHNSITYNNINISKLPTISPRTIRSSRSSRILVQSSTTSSNSIKVRSLELDSDNDASELSTATPHTMITSRSSTQLSATSSKPIEVNNNSASELSAITSRTIKLLSSSRILTWLSTCFNIIEVDNSEVNDDDDASEFFTVTPLATRSSRSSNPAQLSTSSKAIG